MWGDPSGSQSEALLGLLSLCVVSFVVRGSVLVHPEETTPRQPALQNEARTASYQMHRLANKLLNIHSEHAV